jgi:hypothetical protein
MTYLLFFDLSVKHRLLYAGTVFGGFLSHLLLDELYAVKIFTFSTTRSWGTALKFTGKSRPLTMLLYFLIFFAAIGCIYF